MEPTGTATDQAAQRRQPKWIAAIVAGVAVIGGIATFTDSISKIHDNLAKLWPFHKSSAATVQTTQLPFDSGWVFAGYFNASSDRYTGSQYLEVSKTHYSDKAILPRKGDWVRVMALRHVYIRDFATAGKSNQMLGPPSEDGPPSKDNTGVTLPDETQMEVRDVVREGYPGQDQAVWVRVGVIPQ